MEPMIIERVKNTRFTVFCANPKCNLVHKVSSNQVRPVTCECGQVILPESTTSPINNKCHDSPDILAISV